MQDDNHKKYIRFDHAAGNYDPVPATKPQSTTEALEPCPFCPARLSPFPKEHLSPDLHAVAGQWFQITHNAGCFFTLLGFGDYPVHEERLAAWNTRVFPASTAPVVEIAHVCTNGVYRPYPAVLCSSCKYVTHGLSVKELCERLNAAATAAPVEQSAIDLDPLEFWCDLVEVLGHPRPVKVNPVSVIAEVEERLRQIPPTKKHVDVTDDDDGPR